MVGRGRKQVFTPTIQKFQKLERTVKLGLFFYGHFGKVLSLELIFFTNLNQYYYSTSQELRQFYSHLFLGFSGGPPLLLTYLAWIRVEDFKSFLSSFVISRQLVLKIPKETRFTRRYKTKSNSFFQTFTMFGERSNYQRSYFYLSR